MGGMGRTPRQKSAETSHFQGFLFPRFWYETGLFITHSLRPPDGGILQTRFGTAARLFPVWAKERCGLENRRLEPSPPPQNRCAAVSRHTPKSVCGCDAPAGARIGPPGSTPRRQNRCAFVRSLSTPSLYQFSRHR